MSTSPMPDSVVTPTGVVLDKGDAEVWEAAHSDWCIQRTTHRDGSVHLTVWPAGGHDVYGHAFGCDACRFCPYPSIQRERELLAQRTPA